jgi:cyclohexanecarboxyl-CoA dehydrogenase
MSHPMLNDEQRAMQAAARRFAREQLLPGYQAREKTAAVIDRALMRRMGELGLIGVDLGERHGGLGCDSVTAGLVMEEIAYGDFNVAYVQLLGSLMGSIVEHHANAELASAWIPRIVSGQALIGLGLTEPRGGSDAANLALRAVRRGEHYVLDGEKTSISCADQCDAFVVFARTGAPEDGPRGVSAFFVAADSPGLTRTRFDDIGSRVVGRGSLFFDAVEVPAAQMLGAPGKGFSQVMQGFDFSRALIALQCVACAQASVDDAWAYTKERHAFGAPLAQYQGVSFPLAEAESMLAAVRALAYQTLALRDGGQPHTAEAAMCKWMGPKFAFDAIHQSLLTFGHYGWTHDTPHQQRMRDVMGLEIGDGTAQIMKLIIARERVGRMAVQYAGRQER